MAKDPSPNKWRIFLVDDHPIMRRGLAQLIDQQDDMMICGEADDATVAVSLIEDVVPDLVVADISLKGSDGLELVKHLRTRHPSLRMLVLSMYDESLYAERAIRAGAHGYIMKEAATENFLTALRRVLQGEIYLNPVIASRIVRDVIHGSHDIPKSPIDKLSDRELEVFRWIGRGRSAREIALELHLSVKTIETHVSHIKEKLALRNYRELTQRAVRWLLANEQ